MRRWREPRYWLVRQAALWVAGAAVLRLVVVPAETCPPVDAPAARRAVAAAADWLERGRRPDGRFRYGFHRDTGRVAADYNSTRHAGVLDILYRLGRVRAADAGLRYATGNLVSHGGWTAFAAPDEDVNVGANALLVAALVHRRQVTGSPRYDALAHRIARFLVAQQRGDGSVLQFWRRATRRPIPDRFGKFSTGEAFWALTLMREAFPDEGWERPAHRVGEYLATRRDAAEGHAMHQPDHWAAYGLAQLDRLSAGEAAYARRLAGYFGWLIRFESQRTGRPLNPFAESGAELGTIGEATTALWRLAGADARLADLRGDLGRRSTCLAGVLVDRQVRASDPRRRGAWFARDYTQMDDQQHAAAALLGTLEVLR